MPAPNKTKWSRGPEISPPRDYVCFKPPDPCTHADVIQRIAERFKLRLDPLPERLKQYTLRGPHWLVDGSARVVLDRITQEHENLYWTVSDGALRFEVRAEGNLSPSAELAGRLWHEASRGNNGRVSEAELGRIAEGLDNQGFKPVENLEGKARLDLARWNQTRTKKAIHTFSEAIKKRALTVTDPKVDGLTKRRFNPRQAVRRWLSRCGTKWEKGHPER